MQIARIGTAAAVLLLCGAMGLTYSQERERKEKRTNPGRQQGEQRKTNPRRGGDQHQKGQQRAQHPQRTRQQAFAWQEQRGWRQQDGWQGTNSWQQGRAQRWENEHRTWKQRGGYGGYYIPQDRFRLHFGRQHWFRMNGRPTIHMGYPRFSYGGYSFLLVDPWPEYWNDNWWQADDVYIDYDDGYYLYNRRHPSERLAITVFL